MTTIKNKQLYGYIIIIILLVFLLFPFMDIETFETSPPLRLSWIKQWTQQNSIYRPHQSQNLDQVKQNAITALQQIPKFVVKNQEFTRNIHNQTHSFSNILGHSPYFNPNRPHIILSAHIDGPTMNECPAATDAITAIGVIIELTKQLLNQKPDYNLMVVFFDGEEAVDGKWSNKTTLSGSTHFVKTLEHIPSQVYVFDLIGGSTQDPFLAFSNRPHSFPTMKHLAKINRAIYPDTPLFIDPDEKTSDQKVQDDATPFAKQSIPVICLIPSKFPKNHHTQRDTYENVNWTFVEIFANVLYSHLQNQPYQ